MWYFDEYKKTDTWKFIDNTLLKDKVLVDKLDLLWVNSDNDNDRFLRVWNFINLLRKWKTKETIIDTFSNLSQKERDKAQGVWDLLDTYVLKYSKSSDFGDGEEDDIINHKDVEKVISKRNKYKKIEKIVRYVFLVTVMICLWLGIYLIQFLPKDL